MNLYAVIPSRDRPEMLRNLVRQLNRDHVHTIVVDTGYEVRPRLHNCYFTWVEDYTPGNISHWWNTGLDKVAEIDKESDSEYVVAVLNDDVVIPSLFVQILAETIVNTNAAAAYPDQHNILLHKKTPYMIHTDTDKVNVFTRLCGYAFALRGSAGIRADETIKWWYGDDDIDFSARMLGGSVLVGGIKVDHLMPNSTTVGELAVQAGLDRQTFIDKWGRAPW